MIRSIPYLTMALGVLLLIVIGISTSTLDASAPLVPAPPELRWWMRVIVSLVVLVAALYVLVFRKDDSKWAAAALGTILGYWLPS